MSIHELEEHIEFLQKILTILKEESNLIEEIIFKKYVEFGALSKVKVYLQEKGLKTNRDSIYQSNELSAILQSNPKNVNQDIVKLAHKMFKNNSTLINKLYN